MESSSLSVSCSKRAKAPGNFTQLVHCLVDGCNADLSLCRDYHRRHKVCEVHSKTAKVTICGREQRFCQQCSRFHSLVEFDEGKRSCRKRLDGHNRRRRKPQPDTVARNNNSSALALSAQQSPSGPRLLSFNSSPQILPSTVVSSSSWSNMKKPENQTMMYSDSSNHHQHHSNERPFSNQIQFLQGDDSLDPANVVDSDHAPSLLSSGPTRELGLTHAFRPEQQRLDNSYTHRYYDDLGRQYSFGQEGSGKNIAISGAESSSQQHWSSTLNFQGMFQQRNDQGSSAGGSQQTLTFMWE